MDKRIQLLSYSSLLTLHSCPRKFQLYRLNVTEDEMSVEASCNQNVTFAYGHVVGDGIQKILSASSTLDIHMQKKEVDMMDGDKITDIAINRELPSLSCEDVTIFQMYLGWHADLEDRNERQNKSFYTSVTAIQRFNWMREHGFLDDYELVYYNGKPACELSFRITFPDGFVLRGSVDAVLRHKETGEILVLECKTTSLANVDPAMYKNSSQAIGYSVVLDVLFKEISSYKVLYLVYQTKSMSYEQLPFTKTYLQRAQWIQEILHDIEIIKLYENSGVYPMRGESCYDFGRSCEYFSTCTLSTQYLSKPLLPDVVLDTKTYDIELTLEDLIRGQLERTAGATDVEFTESNAVPLMEGDTLL